MPSTAEEEALAAGKNLERLGQTLTSQLAAEVASRTAREETRTTVHAVLEEERKRQEEEAAQRKDRLRPFFRFMESLRNLSASGPGGEGPEGRTELVLKLYRLLESGGPKPSRIFQTQVALSQEEALHLGDPDFEGRTMEWALQQGQFGRFEWRLLGWADGESILDTTCSVTVEQPANYVPPVRPAVATDPEPKLNPMGQLKETLELLGMMRESMGLKGGGGLDATQLEIVKAAAASQARLDVSNEHRRELRGLEDRHRKELEDAERKGFERGKTEGDRTLEAERLRWDLQKAQEAPGGPLGVWWAEWPQVQGIVDQLIGTEEETPGEEGMTVDLESLKTLLLQRLEEGATDEVILAAMREQVLVNVLDQWRGMLRFAPIAFVTDMLGTPEKHKERIKILVKAIQGNY